MENKNIIMLKHPPMNLKYDNPSYTNQVDDDLSEYIVIDVTSRILRNKEFMNEHPTFAKDLSPFFIGPLVASDGEIANIFEHYWQCSKVYPCHYVDGKITPEFFEWRKKWYAKTEVSNKKTDSRYPCQELGHSPKDCLFSVYYDGNEYQKLGYLPIDSETYVNKLAILDDMLIVKASNNCYGVITIGGDIILETKYDSIQYLKETSDFLVESNNKK